VLKRSVDIALAGLLLTVTFPVLAIASIIVKLDSEGPVIFRQVRMGRRFRHFQLLKLRTMRSCSPGLAYTLGEDPRITRAGRWLRWFKFDELPQLWNVLRGDMSLVGPRPVVPELTMEFKHAYDLLLEVRPGLTDPATLKYCRESELLALVPDPLSFFKTVVTPDKIRISRAYLERASVWSDLGVMVGTAFALIPSRLQPLLSRPVSAAERRDSSLFFPEAAPKSKHQPLFEGASIAVPIELLATSAKSPEGMRALRQGSA
jgi:lipopolysaccharide/colanic/teichoic acid biosynthesis glycosyltransferase